MFAWLVVGYCTPPAAPKSAFHKDSSLQAGFINLQILTSALHDSLLRLSLAETSDRSGTWLEARIHDALQALSAQFQLLQEVLRGKVCTYRTLQSFPTRVFASARMDQLCKSICDEIDAVRISAKATACSGHVQVKT